VRVQAQVDPGFAFLYERLFLRLGYKIMRVGLFEGKVQVPANMMNPKDPAHAARYGALFYVVEIEKSFAHADFDVGFSRNAFPRVGRGVKNGGIPAGAFGLRDVVVVDCGVIFHFVSPVSAPAVSLWFPRPALLRRFVPIQGLPGFQAENKSLPPFSRRLFVFRRRQDNFRRLPGPVKSMSFS
jgi:hypothetical protein